MRFSILIASASARLLSHLKFELIPSVRMRGLYCVFFLETIETDAPQAEMGIPNESMNPTIHIEHRPVSDERFNSDLTTENDEVSIASEAARIGEQYTFLCHIPNFLLLI